MFTEERVLAFFNYIYQRELIRQAKANLEPWPWTDDPVLRKYKFTNVKRKNDRTTQHFIKIYNAHLGADPSVALYNCGVFRYFGTMEWANEFGWSDSHRGKKMIDTAAKMLAGGHKVFTGAYVITNSGRTGPKHHVVEEYLRTLWNKADQVVGMMHLNHAWEAGFNELKKLPGFAGTGFMAKEVLQDYLLWTNETFVDEATWTPMGPGARRGMNRVLERDPYYTQPSDIFIYECQMLRGEVNRYWTANFPGTELLTAHDVQFCLCEFDKYERAQSGLGRPKGLYHRRAA